MRDTSPPHPERGDDAAIERKIERAIEAGLAFLTAAQLASGEFPVFTCKRRDMAGELTADPSVFPTALAAHALGVVPGAGALVERALRFLLDQRDPRGVWRHWTRDHPYFAMLPPDLDDTSCASAALARNGAGGAADRRILLANRNRRGLFYTWIVPRLRWTSAPHRRIVARQLRLIPALIAFFRSTSAAPGDVDAVVNANCLYALGAFRGDARVVDHLLGVLRTGRETSCDKWYDNPFVVWYFVSRALSERVPEAADLISRRLASAAPVNPLETALAAASLLYWKRLPERATIAQLLDAQLASGAWPCAALYHGGRARRPDGTFAEPHPDTPHWGSEALTTAFCLQVLAQWRAGRPTDDRQRATERGRRPKVLFVFQGRQGFRIGMGRGLYAAESVFRDVVDRCAKVIEHRLGVNLAAGFHDPEAAERAQSNEFHSILTHGLLHIGLIALWKSKGIEPDGTIGLSLGEITSTVAAGALTPEDAITVVQAAAQWDERVLDRGKLLLMDTDLATAVALCRESPAPLEYFAEYGPTAAVVFCLASDVELISAFLRERGIAHVVHRGDYAYHTPRFANCKDVMLAELAHLRPRPAQCPYYSAFAGGLAPSASFFDANHWYWMLAQPVWFNTAFEAALKDGYDVILNIGPHPSLDPYLRAAAEKTGKAPRFVDSLRDDAPEAATFAAALDTLRGLGLGDGERARKMPTEAGDQVGDLDLGSDEAIRDPYPMLADLRAKGSIPFLRRHGYWLALAHDDVTAALDRPDVFASDPARGLDPVLLGADPDQHARARRILAPHFRATQGAEFEAAIASVTDQCLDAAATSSTVDLVGAFAVPISERVAARFIGLTDAETAELVALIGPDRWVLDYIPRLNEFFAGYVRKDHGRAAGSLWARLTSGAQDQRFEAAEAVGILVLMWVAGTTTTGMLIAAAACTLLYQPDVRAEVAQHPDLIPALIEETLRLEAPEQTVWRRTRAATSLAGTELPPGAAVRLHLGAANRDPVRFAHADSFVLRRERQANLAFGWGIHQCIGAGLARLTCRIALERLLARYPSLWPEKPLNELRYAPSDHFRALASLPARLRGIAG